MGDRRASRYLSGVFRGSDPHDGLARGQSSSDPLPEQSSGGQQPQQAALSLPATSRRSRLFSIFKPRSRSPSQSASRPLGFEGNITNQPIASQSLIVLPPRPHTPHSETSAQQTHGPSVCGLPPPTVGGSVTATMSSSNHGSPSYSNNQGSSISPPVIRISHSQSEPLTSDIPVPASTCAPQSPDVVWTKVLEIAEKKLSDNNLPPLDRTPQLMAGTVEEHMQAVVNTLNILEKDNRKKGWSYTWGGKKVIVVEQLGKILKQVTPYTKVLDIAIQANTQVRALVWAGVRAIMQVRINSSLYIAHTACEY